MAVNRDANLALATAHKVIDYAMVCYMTGTCLLFCFGSVGIALAALALTSLAGTQLARITQSFVELSGWFHAAIAFIRNAPPRTTVNFFGARISRHGHRRYDDNIFQNDPSAPTGLSATNPSPSILGFTTPAASNIYISE